jgi:hypothetical protein
MRSLLVFMTLIALLPSIPAQSGPVQTWTSRDVDVDVLHVAAGETLRILGSTVTVHDAVLVDAGGTLELGPAGPRPTIVQGDAHGFWMSINGTLRAVGTPATVLQNFRGEGLDSVLLQPGGIKVAGNADLGDVVVRNGTAGIAIQPTGAAWIHDSRIEDLYLMGVASLGQLTLERTSVTGNIIGVTGKGDACHIVVRDSHLESLGANLQVNGCDATVEGSSLVGGDNTVVLNGRLELNMTQVSVTGYLSRGLRSDGSAIIRIQDAFFEPRPLPAHGEPKAFHLGIELRAGNEADLRNVTLRGHRDDGLLAESSIVRARECFFEDNGGYGIRLYGESVAQLRPTNTFLRNGKGSVQEVQSTLFEALDGAGNPAPGLHVELDAADGSPVANATQPGSAATLVYETYRNDTYAGPFHYRASYLAAPHGVAGQLSNGTGVVRLSPQAPAPASSRLRLLVAGSAGILAVVAWAASRRRRRGRAVETAAILFVPLLLACLPLVQAQQGSAAFVVVGPNEVRVELHEELSPMAGWTLRRVMDANGDGFVNATEAAANLARTQAVAADRLGPPGARVLLNGTLQAHGSVVLLEQQGAVGALNDSTPVQLHWVMRLQYPTSPTAGNITLRMEAGNLTRSGFVPMTVTQASIEAPPGYRIAATGGLPLGATVDAKARVVSIPGGLHRDSGTLIVVFSRAAPPASAPGFGFTAEMGALALALLATGARGRRGGRMPPLRSSS